MNASASQAALRPCRLRRDGTLFDPPADRRLHPVGLRRRRRTAVPSDRDASFVIGLGLADALQHAAPRFPKERYRELADRFRHHYLASLDQVVLFDGTVEMLRALKERNHWLGVATGKTRRGLDDALRSSPLDGLFDQRHGPTKPAASRSDDSLESCRDGRRPARTLRVGDTRTLSDCRDRRL